MPKGTFVVTVEVTVNEEGANVNEVLQAVSQAREAFGTQLAQAVIEWMQQSIRRRLCGSDRQAKKGLGSHPEKTAPEHRCRGRGFVKEGYRPGERCLMTDLGRVEFRVGYIRCRRCGKKFAPILDVLGLRPRQGHAAQLERLVAEASCSTSFARSVEELEGLAGVPISRSSSHRWVADLKLPEAKPPPLQMLMADGTGYKKAGRRRGELRVAIGLTNDGRIVPLGSWSGKTWKAIGGEVRRRLRRHRRPAVAVVDGERGLDHHFARLAQRTQRSTWHFLRDLRVLLWRDGLKKAQTDPLQNRLAGIIGIDIPEEDWQEIPPLTRHALREQVDTAREQFQAMIDEFDRLGYRQGSLYLQGARDRIFSRIDLWLQTGIIAPSSTGVLEEIMRELGRRVKKLGWNWKDHGVTQQASMILLRRYSQDQWEDYWRRRLDLRDRCQIHITGFQCPN
jgi:hypothetical protein